MKPVLEKIQTTPTSSFSLYRRSEEHYPFMWHRHPEYELVAIVSGHGQRFVGDHSEHYDPGDLVLIGPDLPHTWHSHATGNAETLCEAVVAQFSADCFGSVFFDLPEMAQVRRLLADSIRGIHFAGTESVELQQRLGILCDASPAKRLVGFLDVLCRLSVCAERSLLSSRVFADRPCSERESRLNVALNHIHTNYAESIRQEHVADMMNMSASAFCRFFKRCTGKPFVRYLNELRVGYACRLLMETDRTVSEICYEVGFGNLSHFNRQFREIKGTTPSAFRHHCLGATP